MNSYKIGKFMVIVLHGALSVELGYGLGTREHWITFGIMFGFLLMLDFFYEMTKAEGEK